MTGVAKDWRVRFTLKYDVGEPNQCWEWKGYVPSKGYAVFRMNATGYRETAHRAAFIFHKGPIPEGKYVLHSCDNKKCVNPNHLHLGSHLDNMRESAERERHFRGSRWEKSHLPVIPKGENHKRHKLTTEQVLRIRNSGNSGVVLAEEFGVAPITISRVRRKLAWRHIA